MKSAAGIDLVEVSRFRGLPEGKNNPFLRKVFSENELDYCFAYEDPSVHLAGMFALKEAVSKALGVNEYPFAEVEIRHEIGGAPYASHEGKRLPVTVSISHTNAMAVAIAVV